MKQNVSHVFFSACYSLNDYEKFDCLNDLESRFYFFSVATQHLQSESAFLNLNFCFVQSWKGRLGYFLSMKLN